jgi:hypothetical protein
MSKGSGHRRETDVKDRLARLVDTAQFARVVPRLSPEVLHQLIQHRGLDACGPLVSAATPQQLASVLDLDLWRAAPGLDDRFDERPFGSWLETLMDEDEAVAVRLLVTMDRSLAIVGLSRYVRVFDPGVLSSIRSEDEELECEVGGYVVRGRTSDAWDAIVGLLVALADGHPDDFHALMQGCRRLSNSTPEADGFYSLMLEPAQWLYGVSLDREERRTQQGYLGAADARAFIQTARQPRSSRRTDAPLTNPIAAAYFRALDEAVASAAQSVRSERSEEVSIDPDVSESIEAVVDLLAEAGIAPARPRALLAPAQTEARLAPLEPLMEYLHDRDPVAYSLRNRELAFLANALLAGCSVYSRPFSVQEAWNAAVGVCNIGLEAAPLADAFLVAHDLVTAFEAGWSLLHEDVSLFIATRLIATLAEVQRVDTDVQRDLHRLRRELARQRDAGTPWHAGKALEVIAILDTPTWACLCGLLSECPVWPVALTAILERHAGSVSATAFECFTSRSQILKVREFAERLRDDLL